MSDSEDETGRLDAAARWYSELQDPDVDLATWDAFRAWERDPANAAAFRQIEASLSVVDAGLRAGAGRGASDPERSPGKAWPSPRRRLAWIAGIAAVLVLCAFALALTAHPGDAVGELYATAVGEQRTVTLSDGSQVTLNTDTAMEVTLGPRERRVSLMRGQALFEVAKAGTPFIVTAANSQTRALGTRFEIYMRPADVAVTLLEGAVVVSAPDPGTPQPGNQVLAPGERLTIAGDGSTALTRVDPGSVVQWASGMVVFDNVTLAEAIEDLNRYSETKIRVVDPALAGERLSGTFPTGEPEAFVASLALFLPVRAERSGRSITLVTGHSQTP